MPNQADFRFMCPLRVRWAEVDAQQVVFNGHYLTYLDTAVSDFWRAAGLPYPEAFRHLQGDLFARRHTIEYHAPARLDDRLDLGVRCERVGNSSITVAWAAWAQGRLLVTGEAVYVFTSLATGRSATVPDSLKAQLHAHEQGSPVHRLDIGTWGALAEQASAVRRAVFITEQGIPEAEEWDAEDAGATHAVIGNLAGLPLATGRLIHQGQQAGHAKIGRMAVLRSSRGVGLGDQVLRALIEQARLRHIEHLSLHAQVSARAFYARHGFAPEGEVFDEVDIPHQRMVLTLAKA